MAKALTLGRVIDKVRLMRAQADGRAKAAAVAAAQKVLESVKSREIGLIAQLDEDDRREAQRVLSLSPEQPASGKLSD